MPTNTAPTHVVRMKNTKPNRFLPMAWHVVHISPNEIYTFRWGRGAGYFTVHHGDIGSSPDDNQILETVQIGHDWTDENDVATQARNWLRHRTRPRRQTA